MIASISRLPKPNKHFHWINKPRFKHSFHFSCFAFFSSGSQCSVFSAQHSSTERICLYKFSLFTFDMPKQKTTVFHLRWILLKKMRTPYIDRVKWNTYLVLYNYYYTTATTKSTKWHKTHGFSKFQANW